MTELQQQRKELNHTKELFRYEKNPNDGRGRRLVASRSIQEGRLVFVERPVVAMQSLGNMHEGVLVCNYCLNGNQILLNLRNVT